MNIQINADPLPEKAISPNLWSLFSLWDMNVEELGREFTQIIKFYAPDKSLFVLSETPFQNSLDGDYQHKVNLQMTSLPIWSEGFAEAVIWLKGNDTPSGSYRFEIKHVRAPQPTNDAIPSERSE